MPLRCSYGYASFGAETTLPARILVVPSNTSTTEGGSVSFTVFTQNLPSPLTFYWGVYGLRGIVDYSDFSTDAWGSYTDSNNQATSGNVTLALGHQTGTNKTFYYTIQARSTTSYVISTSTAITIISPLYTGMAVSNNLMYEGQGTSTFTVSTSGCVDGTVLYYTARATIGTISNSTFNSGLTYGTFTITNNIGTFSLSSAYEDGNNTDDTYVVDIRTDSTDGPVVITSPTVKMVDLTNYNALYAAYSSELTNKYGGKTIGISLVDTLTGTACTATFAGNVLTANRGNGGTRTSGGTGGTASGGTLNITGGTGTLTGLAGTGSGGSGGAAGGNNNSSFTGASWPEGTDQSGLFAFLNALGYVTVSTAYVAPNVQNILKGGRGGNNTQNITNENGFDGKIGGGGGGGGYLAGRGFTTAGGNGGYMAVCIQYSASGSVTGRVIRSTDPSIGSSGHPFLETIPNGADTVKMWVIGQGGYTPAFGTAFPTCGAGAGGMAIRSWSWTAPTAPTKPAGPPPPITGQIAFTTTGTYTWVCPTGVTKVSVVCVGAGGAGSGQTPLNSGGGGALAYVNNISVTPGQSYTVVVGAPPLYNSTSPGGDSSFGTFCVAGGGRSGREKTVPPLGGQVIKGTGGAGGGGAAAGAPSLGAGGGGAGGYSGAGGAGSQGANTGGTGSGGGGGGGYGGTGGEGGGLGGGGVGILGQGANGRGGDSADPRGQGGSGGGNATLNLPAGLYGGGQACGVSASAGSGAVRIIWSDTVERAFPSTNTGNL